MPEATSPTMSLATALTRLAKQPDADAWAAVVDGMGEDLQRLACRLTGSAALADDAVQEVLLLVRDRADTFSAQSTDPDADARRWITRIAINVSLKLLRSQQRLSERERRAAESSPASSDEVPNGVIRDEHLALLRQALAQLPEAVRAAIVLHHITGAGFKEVALQFNCPIGTVKARVSRGLVTLRSLLMKDGVVLSASAITHTLHRFPMAPVSSAHLLSSCHQLLHAPVTASVSGLPMTASTGMSLTAKFLLGSGAVTIAALGVLAVCLISGRTSSRVPAMATVVVPATAPVTAPPATRADTPPVVVASATRKTAPPLSLLIPPAYAVVMIPQMERVLDHLVTAGISSAAFNQLTTPRQQLGAALHDPELTNLRPEPVMLVISRGDAQPQTAVIIPCLDPQRYVDAGIAGGMVGQVESSLAVLATSASGLAAALPTAREYQRLASAEGDEDVRFQCSPRQLASDFAPLLHEQLATSSGGNPQLRSLLDYGLETSLRLAADVELISLDVSLRDQSLLIDGAFVGHPGSPLAHAWQPLALPAGPRAQTRLPDHRALFALSGSYPCAALTHYALSVFLNPDHPSPISSLITPELIPLIEACTQDLTGDVAVRLLPTADRWVALQQVSGSTDASATQSANRRLLDAQNAAGLDFLGIAFQRVHRDLQLDGLTVDGWSYALRDASGQDSHLPDPRVAALKKLLNPCMITSTPGFVSCAPDLASLATLVHAPSDAAHGMHLHAEGVLSAGADGYWDLDVAGIMDCCNVWLRPLVPGNAAAPASPPPASDDDDLVCGSWTITPGSCQWQLRLPDIRPLTIWLTHNVNLSPGSTPPEPPPTPTRAPPTTPVRPLF